MHDAQVERSRHRLGEAFEVACPERTGDTEVADRRGGEAQLLSMVAVEHVLCFAPTRSGLPPVRATKARYFTDRQLARRVLAPPATMVRHTARRHDWDADAPFAAAVPAAAEQVCTQMADSWLRRQSASCTTRCAAAPNAPPPAPSIPSRCTSRHAPTTSAACRWRSPIVPNRSSRPTGRSANCADSSVRLPDTCASCLRRSPASTFSTAGIAPSGTGQDARGR